MKRITVGWKIVLFLLIFVFSASLTVSENAFGDAPDCCTIPCEIGCNPASVQGIWRNVGQGPQCILVGPVSPCWVGYCECT